MNRPAPADAAELNRALALLQQGRADEAVRLAGRVARRLPGWADARHLLALARKGAGDREGALAAFAAARRLAPNDVALLCNHANLLADMGRLDEAIAQYCRALALAPGHGQGWLNLGLALLDAGDPSEAERALPGMGTACRVEGNTIWR